jgi:hypothetical protein
VKNGISGNIPFLFPFTGRRFPPQPHRPIKHFPANPNHVRLHLSLHSIQKNIYFQKKKLSRRTYISKKKTIQKNRTPRLQIQPAAGPVAASIPDRRQRAQPRRSPTRSRPLAQTSDSEHNPGGRGLWFPSTGLCILGEWFGLGIACILAKFAEA